MGKVNCQYCTSQNEPEDHRCQRCGRRLSAETERPRYNHSALAPAIEPEEWKPAEPAVTGLKLVQPPAIMPERSGGPAYQGSLFGPQEVKTTAKPPARKPSHPQPQSNSILDRPVQGMFDFSTAGSTGSRTLRTSVEASIYCNATVAPTPMRVMAVIFDTSLSLLGMGALLAAEHFSESSIVLTEQPLWFYLVTALVCIGLYRVIYCLANGDTAGVQWTGLRILNFDGRRPTRRQRFERLAGGCVSVVAIGLGILWALFEEEKLTWHDLMSKTFPTTQR